MLANESGHQGGNLGVDAISISSLVVRMGKDEWQACLTPIQPAKGSPFSRFEVNLVHPMSPINITSPNYSDFTHSQMQLLTKQDTIICECTTNMFSKSIGASQHKLTWMIDPIRLNNKSAAIHDIAVICNVVF